LEKEKILSWGIVPTLKEEYIDGETVERLVDRWKQQVLEIERLGVDRQRVFAQSLITPSCGTGALDLKHAMKVLELTRGVSDMIRSGVL
ncbi:MAG: hypothetical protein V1753_03330, partial [Pseudomonadota bacterium]